MNTATKFESSKYFVEILDRDTHFEAQVFSKKSGQMCAKNVGDATAVLVWAVAYIQK